MISSSAANESALTMTLVVAGPARAGKSALLRAIQSRMAPERRVGMPVGSMSDNGLVDWLPIDLGLIAGRAVIVHMYVIPSPSGADATRRLILENADGILFVADSQAHRADENVAAMVDLWGGLGDANDDPRRVPMVMLYTKQDLPPELIMPRVALDDLLNVGAVPSFAADALRGAGVLEALQAVIGPTLRGLASHALAPTE